MHLKIRIVHVRTILLRTNFVVKKMQDIKIFEIWSFRNIIDLYSIYIEM